MANNILDEIIKDTTPHLRSYVRSRVSNSEDAEDIVQDTLYKLARAFSIMENPIGKISAWIYTVAHNLIINHGKKKHEKDVAGTTHEDYDKSFMLDLSEIMVSADHESPDIIMLREMVWEELHKALAELPAEQREAVEMTEIQGLSVKDAAKQMGVPLNTFLSRKHYAVKHIRKRLHSLYTELLQD